MGDNIRLKLSSTGHVVQEQEDKHEAMKQQLQNKKILCRICKGDHFTSKCPYKDSLGVEDAAAAPSSVPMSEPGNVPVVVVRGTNEEKARQIKGRGGTLDWHDGDDCRTD